MPLRAWSLRERFWAAIVCRSRIATPGQHSIPSRYEPTHLFDVEPQPDRPTLSCVAFENAMRTDAAIAAPIEFERADVRSRCETNRH